MKKIISLMLALVLVFVIASQNLMPEAYSSYYETSGKCGANAYWAYNDNNGQLTISGSGKMLNFATDYDQPWRPLKQYIYSVKVTGVSSIGNCAFQFLHYLTSVSLSSSIKTIGERAFMGDENLEKITIPNSVTSIGNRCFCYCSNLSSVVIGNGIKEIPPLMFSECQNLTSITITKNVKQISGGAFSKCYSLKKVFYTGTNSDWKKIKILDEDSCLRTAKIIYSYSAKESIRCSARNTSAQKISWNKVSGVNGYQVQRSNNGGTAWSTSYTTTSTSYVFKKLTAGGKYKFRVRTYKTVSGTRHYGKWSSTLCSCCTPAKPTLKSVSSPKHTQIKTIWSKAGGTKSGYQILYGKNSSFSSISARKNVSGSYSSYTGKNFTKGRTYYVKVRTYTTFGGKTYYSGWSAAKRVKCK